MATAYDARVPAWFWAVSAMALLWEAIGCWQYLTVVRGADPMPVWVTAAFAIATWSGLAAAALLILRRRWARELFVLSLVAAVVQMLWVFFLSGAGVQPVGLVVLAVGALLVWFAGLSAGRGFLR